MNSPHQALSAAHYYHHIVASKHFLWTAGTIGFFFSGLMAKVVSLGPLFMSLSFMFSTLFGVVTSIEYIRKSIYNYRHRNDK